MIISPGKLDDPRVVDLLRFHLVNLHTLSPAGHVFALDLSGLKRPDIAFFTAWEGEDLLGCGALRELGPAQGELKSMRTAPGHLRKGVAAALLRHMLGEAGARGYRRVSLETGTGPAFDPAIALYTRFGFVKGAAFGDYAASAFNQFFHLDLPAAG